MHDSPKVVTLHLGVTYKEADREALLEFEISREIGECLVYEANQRIEEVSKTARLKRNGVYQAFVNIGRVKSIWGKDYVSLSTVVYNKAKEKLIDEDFPEIELQEIAESGIKTGEFFMLPKQMGLDGINYGFVADTVISEISGVIRYVEGVGWEVWKEQGWQKRPKERGIVGIIYHVMRMKMNIWRKALEEKNEDVRGAGGWLEKLAKKVSNPKWLRGLEELLLRVDFFGVPFVVNQAHSPTGAET